MMEFDSGPPARGSVGMAIAPPAQNLVAKAPSVPPTALQKAKAKANAELAAKFAAEQQAARGTADRSSRLSMEQFAARSRSRAAGESLSRVSGAVPGQPGSASAAGPAASSAHPAAKRAAQRASSRGAPATSSKSSGSVGAAGTPRAAQAPAQQRGHSAGASSPGRWKPNLRPPAVARPIPPWDREPAAPKPGSAPRSGGRWAKAPPPPPPRGAGGRGIVAGRPLGPSVAARSRATESARREPEKRAHVTLSP